MKTLLAASRGTGNKGASTTGYGVLVGLTGLVTAESEGLLKMRVQAAGTFSGFGVRVNVNTRGASTYTFRKNGANGNQALSVGASATGLFQDTTNSDTVAAGDDVDYTWTTGAGGTTYQDRPAFVYFEHATDAVTLLGAADTIAYSTASTSNPLALNGTFATAQTEAHVELKFWKGGTLAKLTCNVGANTRSDASTLKSRVNGANGNLSLSIPAATTGAFSDTTNSDTLADGDRANLALDIGAGTGTLTLRNTCAAFTSPDGYSYLMGAGQQAAINANLTRYLLLNYLVNVVTTETDTQAPVGASAVRVSNLRVYVGTNTVTATSTATVRLNGADTSIAVSIASSTTGEFTDTTNEAFTAATTDWVALKVVTGATGTSLGVRSAGVLVAHPRTATLTSASAAASALDASVTLGGSGVTATLSSATAAASALNAAVTLGTLAVSLSAATAAASALDPSITLGALAVALSAATAAASALDVQHPTGVLLGTASAVASAPDVGITLGTLAVALGSALAAASTLPVSLTFGGLSVPVSSATATASALGVTPVLGTLLVALGSASAAATALGVTVTFGTAAITLTPASAGASGLTVGITLGGVSKTLTAATAAAVATAITAIAASLNPVDVDALSELAVAAETLARADVAIRALGDAMVHAFTLTDER